MKKLSLILFFACLASCSTYSPIVSFVDYSAFNDQGMFLTESNSVRFDYEPVGSVNVLLYSGYTVKELPKNKSMQRYDDVYYSAPIAGSFIRTQRFKRR